VSRFRKRNRVVQADGGEPILKTAIRAGDGSHRAPVLLIILDSFAVGESNHKSMNRKGRK
jgi:hypothetical protein